MKICTFVGICGVLGLTGAVVAQQMAWSVTSEVPLSTGRSVALSHVVGSPAHGACEGDCGIDWHQFRNGDLWQTYCAEKRDHQLGRLAGPDCQTDMCDMRRGGDGDCLPLVHRPCGRHRKKPANLLDVFHDLLGWQHSGCDSATCDRSCCASGDRVPGSDSETGADLSNDAPNALPAITDPVLDDPSSFDDDGDELKWDTDPKIPRNTIPKPPAETSESSHVRSPRAVVAERLSDYIKTR